METEYDEEFGNNVPDLNIEEDETPFVGSISTTKESHMSILQKKMIEIEEMFEEQEEE